MRAVVAASGLTLLGCGPVHLGDERPGELMTQDADAAVAALDANDASRLQANVAVRADEISCNCFVLSASASHGQAPYSFEWEDGSHEPRRRVCVTSKPSLSVRDAAGAEDRIDVTLQEPPDAACPPPPQLLCLENLSFEGKPAANFGLPNNFDGAPWSACNDTSSSNTPELVNDTIPQWVVAVPDPTDGVTFLGMIEGEQVSQKLCRGLAAGSTAMFTIDLSRLYIGAGVVPDGERPFLEIWGGHASDCSARELLWSSPLLDMSWINYCVVLKPTQYVDLLVLRARADGSQDSSTYMIADNLRPVAACP